MQTIVDVLGWVGAVLLVGAYALVSLKKVEGDSILFQGINIVAGIFLITNTVYWKAYPSSALNMAWVGVALYTLWKKHSIPK